MKMKPLILCLALLSTSTLAIAGGQNAPRFTTQAEAETYLNGLLTGADLNKGISDVAYGIYTLYFNTGRNTGVQTGDDYDKFILALEKFSNTNTANTETVAKILAKVNPRPAYELLLKMNPSFASTVLKVIDPTAVIDIFSELMPIKNIIQHEKWATEHITNPKELAATLARLNTEKTSTLQRGAASIAPIAKLMPPEKLAQILAQLTPEEAGAILEAMGEEAAKKVAQAIEEGYSATASSDALKAAMSEAAKTTVTGWTIWTQTSEAAPTVNKYQQLVDAILAAKAAGGISNQQAQQAVQQAVQQSGGNVVVPSPSAP